MTVVAPFETPGRLRDAPAGSPFYAAWHRVVGELIADRVALSGPGQSVDPAQVSLDVRHRRTLTWTGFSRPLLVEHRDDRAAAFAAGEDRATQIEYLEWHVTRADGRIRRVEFSTETPEYYRTLAASEPDAVLTLYRQLVDPGVRAEEIFPGGVYDPMNHWNTTDGLVHYIMRVNSMKDLLGVSQEVPDPAGARDGYDALPYRRATGADARIGFDHWAIARTGSSIATANSPGVYMIDWDDTGFARPDGTPVDDYWTVLRGAPGAALRLRYEVPAAEGFTVSDIHIGGRPITTGGQLAEHIVMSAHVDCGVEQ